MRGAVTTQLETTVFKVHCMVCHLSTPCFPTEEAAVEAWNERFGAPQKARKSISAQIKALEDQVRQLDKRVKGLWNVVKKIQDRTPA